MSENEKKGCFGGALMTIGSIGLILGIIYSNGTIANIGFLIPLGYLINSTQ